MLDWIREHNQSWLFKLILALIGVPFALFGVSSYFGQQSSAGVATVDGVSISVKDYQKAYKQMAAAHQQSADTNSSTNDPVLRQLVLSSLVRQQVLLNAAQRAGMVVSDVELAGFISDIAAFQVGGKFDQQHYLDVLRQQGLSVKQFEKMAKDQLFIQDMHAPFVNLPLFSQTAFQQFEGVYAQKREVSALTLSVADVAAKTTVPPAQVQAYYDKHHAEFTLPPRAQYQYAVLSLDGFAQHVVVNPAAIQAYYQQNSAQFQSAEQREAKHILIAVTPSDSVQKHAEAQALADQLSLQLKQHPERFSELVKQYSNDPSSVQQGGDLGWFGRDAMVKPFSDAVFAMQVGQISAPILTDYGYHIIQLTGVRPAQMRSLADATNEITTLLQQQQAGTAFADAADRFTNQVFEHPNELTGIAKQLELPLQTSSWMTTQGGDTPELNHPKMLQALFSADVLKNHHNTEALEVAPNVLVAARLLSYQGAQLQPLSAVAPQITQTLRMQGARATIAQQGASMLALLRKGNEPADLHWGDFAWISHANPGRITSSALLSQLFAVDPHGLPAYVGVQDSQGDYQLVRVTQVADATPTELLAFQSLGAQFAHFQADQAFEDYVDGLVTQAKVQVHQTVLEKALQ